MTWYKNLEITKKLIIGFILVALVAGIIGIVGIVSINNIDKGSREMYDNHTASMPDLGDIARNYQRQRVIIRDLYINKDINIVNERAKEIIEARDLMVQSINNFDRRIINTEVREKFDSLTKVIGEFDEFSEDVISSIQEGDKDKAYELLTGDLAQRISRDVRILTDELMTLKSNLANENAIENSNMGATAVITMIVFIVIGIVISIILGIFIARLISNPLEQIAGVSNKLAVGDIDVSLDYVANDEIGELATSIRAMIKNIQNQALIAEKIAEGDMTIEVNVQSANDVLGNALRNLVEQNNEVLSNIAFASEQVSTGAQQVSDSSISLSQGATEQASSIEELTASLEEIGSQTRLNADNANKANDLAERTKEHASEGNVQMNSATSEESAAASEELSSQSHVLMDMISQYKLTGTDNSPGMKV